MRYKAILVGALVKPFGKSGGDPAPWQVFHPTKERCVEAGKNILARLSEKERKIAYIRIAEVTEVTVMEVHVATEKGPDDEIRFAITE